jgi:hypothetical protein
MSQGYHTNAKTNLHSRKIIQNSSETNADLAKRFAVSTKTIKKWRTREIIEDKSSRPHNIQYALTETERQIIKVVRTLSWMQLDDLFDCVSEYIPKANRSNVYRTLVDFGINRVPEEQREKAKKFKEYEPGYLHIDVTYLPRIDGQKDYLFVAIDRATRLLYINIFPNKTAANATTFLNECKQ